MSFLHAHKKIHRDLKPENILMDDFLCPKNEIFHSNLESLSITDSAQAVKGTPIYTERPIINNLFLTHIKISLKVVGLQIQKLLKN